MVENNGPNRPRDIYTITDLMAHIPVMQPFEEDKYSEVPGWSGNVLSWTPKAVLFEFPDLRRPFRENWFPISTLRKAEDDQSVYASIWILNKKGL